MQTANLPNDIASYNLISFFGATVVVVYKFVLNIFLPCIVVAIAEDDIVGAHLHDAMNLAGTNQVLNRIGADEVTHAAFAPISVHARTRVDGDSTARIWTHNQLIEYGGVLIVIFFAEDQIAIV